MVEEAKYYGVEELLPLLQEHVRSSPKWNKDACAERPLSRGDVVSATLATPTERELRFQGVNMEGADLSRLDLRHINFKYEAGRLFSPLRVFSNSLFAGMPT